MEFASFKVQVEKAGLIARECNEFHWQIRGGGLIVNYYPTKGTVYANGTLSGVGFSSPKNAIDIALQSRALVAKFDAHGMLSLGKSKRKKDYRGIKKYLYKKHPFCHICKKQFAAQAEATLDHIIPLAKGGANKFQNYALAHEKCNSRTDDKIHPLNYFQKHSPNTCIL